MANMDSGSETSIKSLETIKESFAKINKQIEDLQITHAEWKKYVTAKKDLDFILENPSTAKAILFVKAVIVFVVVTFFLLLLLFTLYNAEMLPEGGVLGSVHFAISKLYVETYLGEDMNHENCIITFVEPAQDLFRPPVNCEMCIGMEAIDHRVDLTVEEFRERYAYTSRPLVVTDGMEGWTALDTYSFEYLKRDVYPVGGKALERVKTDCQFFPYATSFESLEEVFNMTTDEAYLRDGEDSKPWYVGWSNCEPFAANALRKHYKRPYFLPEESESSKTDWIFMGSPGYGAPNHIDAVDLPSWQAQVRGHKVWTLNPPPECYFQCGGEMSATLHPGYIVIVDTNSWFHSTKVVGDEMSITIGSEYD